MRCTSPQIDSSKPGQSFEVHLADLGAVAQVYQPNKVILEAKGFADLIERMSFLNRIGTQDAQVVSTTRSTGKADTAFIILVSFAGYLYRIFVIGDD